MSVFMCLMVMAQGRISLFHLYDWSESPTGVVTVTEADPYYYGGWTVNLLPVADEGRLIAENGITLYDVAQPLIVDYRNHTVTLDATSDEPFASVNGTRITVTDGVTTTVDSVLNYYVVNEGWVTGGELQDVTGELLADDAIHIADGFAYYIETVKTTTITERDGSSRTFTDETSEVSRIFRDLWLITPNGKHEFTLEGTNETRTVDVYIHQSGDTVYVKNIYGYGAPEIYMLLNEDGTMTYPAQVLRDIPNSVSPNGDGMWYNATPNGNNVTAGCNGNVSAEAITWGLTKPWDHARTWSGWTNNKLYFTDGSQFIVPGGSQWLPGDVNHDGTVDVSDVTATIASALGSDPSPFFMTEADLNGDGVIDVSDVTAVISHALGS